MVVNLLIYAAIPTNLISSQKQLRSINYNKFLKVMTAQQI